MLVLISTSGFPEFQFNLGPQAIGFCHIHSGYFFLFSAKPFWKHLILSQAGFSLTIQLKMALNLGPSCLLLLNAGIVDMHYMSWGQIQGSVHGRQTFYQPSPLPPETSLQCTFNTLNIPFTAGPSFILLLGPSCPHLPSLSQFLGIPSLSAQISCVICIVRPFSVVFPTLHSPQDDTEGATLSPGTLTFPW